MPFPEKALIAQIRRLAKPSNLAGRRRGAELISRGIGDDCAVLRVPPRHDSLITTDFTLEGIHFRREWHSPETVGHRCLTRGLSDIAAMGGEPAAAFLSLALPRNLPQVWVNRFLRGLISLAQKHGITLAGGDTAESPDGILADIMVVGSIPKGKAVLRSGARPGDRIYVSGELGGSAAALVRLRAGFGLHHPEEFGRRHPERGRFSGGAKDLPNTNTLGAKTSRRGKTLNPRDYLRHFYPDPRVELGRILRERGLASAMIDLSDGLSTDLAHICEESGVGAEVEAAAIPRSRVGRPAREVDLDLALYGGEDYELLFTAPHGKRIPRRLAGIPITQIGHVTRGNKVLIFDRQVGYELEPGGWEHFR